MKVLFCFCYFIKDQDDYIRLNSRLYGYKADSFGFREIEIALRIVLLRSLLLRNNSAFLVGPD